MWQALLGAQNVAQENRMIDLRREEMLKQRMQISPMSVAAYRTFDRVDAADYAFN